MSNTSITIIQLAQESLDKTLVAFMNQQNHQLVLIGEKEEKPDFPDYPFIIYESHQNFPNLLEDIQQNQGLWNLIFIPIKLSDLQKDEPNHIQETWASLKFIVPKLAENGGGQIILISFVQASDISDSSKLMGYQQAIGGFMRTLALETSKLNVRINLIHLPLMKDEEKADQFSDEMQEILSYLLDEENNNITATEQWMKQLF